MPTYWIVTKKVVTELREIEEKDENEARLAAQDGHGYPAQMWTTCPEILFLLQVED